MSDIEVYLIWKQNRDSELQLTRMLLKDAFEIAESMKRNKYYMVKVEGVDNKKEFLNYSNRGTSRGYDSSDLFFVGIVIIIVLAFIVAIGISETRYSNAKDNASSVYGVLTDFTEVRGAYLIETEDGAWACFDAGMKHCVELNSDKVKNADGE